MRLSASLMNENRYDEFLAEVEVANDTPEKWDDDGIRRLVAGRVTATGPIWNDFIGFWSRGIDGPMELDGRRYFGVNLLQVDHDFYPEFSWINLEGQTIRLILLEHFYGSVEEYKKELDDRNQKIEDYLARVERGDFTLNDMRGLLRGLPPLDAPHLNERMSDEAMEKYRPQLLDRKFTRNMIV
jgi:hypothetical protein